MPCRAPQYLWSHLFARTQSLRARIVDHPFNTGLGDGSLPEEQFLAYLLQDLPYLRGYAQGMRTAGRRAPDARGRDILMRFADDTIAAEEDIRHTYLRDIPHDTPDSLPLLNDFLQTLDDTTRNAPAFATVLAILVPCPKIYHDIGNALPDPAPSNRYGPWINGYRNNADFTGAVTELCDYARLHINALHCPIQQRRTIEAFDTGLQFEFDFFDRFSPMGNAPLPL